APVHPLVGGDGRLVLRQAGRACAGRTETGLRSFRHATSHGLDRGRGTVRGGLTAGFRPFPNCRAFVSVIPMIHDEIATVCPSAAFGTPVVYPWVPDQGDGTFRNPILCADYSDPDLIRDGGDFYMVASSFNCTPGLPILHSRDL